tara:strand:+ start:748 stop:1128 length:381 start_codon:yes stop_codon:yes gene_type:complete
LFAGPFGVHTAVNGYETTNIIPHSAGDAMLVFIFSFAMSFCYEPIFESTDLTLEENMHDFKYFEVITIACMLFENIIKCVSFFHTLIKTQARARRGLVCVCPMLRVPIRRITVVTVALWQYYLGSP